jgi:hypothetical protein
MSILILEKFGRDYQSTKSVGGRFAELYRTADAAGKAAAEACRPAPMIVGTAVGLSNKIDESKPQYFVPDGVCGFAWIQFPGNTAFGKWAKAQKLARPAYPKGLSIWVSDYGQSIQLKEAYAWAFARVLQEAGIKAYSGSRMD